MDRFDYYIEIAGGCNLRCPSCPVGNFRPANLTQPRPKGFMSPDRFFRILEKIGREHSRAEELWIFLYNWGEPLLHPQVADFISAVHAAGFQCGISTNLNYTRHLEAVVRACPEGFVISLSGYYQETYGLTHEGGNVETVKQNMISLSRLIQAHGSPMPVSVAYHAYRHNCGRDFLEMKGLCEQLGFHFNPYWAYFSPLEKFLRYIDGDPLEADQDLMRLFIVDPREHQRIAERHTPRNSDCLLRSHRLNIGVDGSVEHCCVTYDPSSNVAQDFLAIPHGEIQARRYQSRLCRQCMGKSLHGLYTRAGDSELSILGNRTIARSGSPVRLYPDGRVRIASPGEAHPRNVEDEEPLRLLLEIYHSRPDLQQAYPEVTRGGYARLIDWAQAVANGESADSCDLLLKPLSQWLATRSAAGLPVT